MSDPSSFNEQPHGEARPGPAGAPTSDEKTWALLNHLSQLLISFVGPLVVMLTKGNESSWVKAHATEALNFSITCLIGFLISAVLTVFFIGVLTGLAVLVAMYVLAIIAGIKAYNGETYRYPLTLRLVK